jgi:hypothetical protein
LDLIVSKHTGENRCAFFVARHRRPAGHDSTKPKSRETVDRLQAGSKLEAGCEISMIGKSVIIFYS